MMPNTMNQYKSININKLILVPKAVTSKLKLKYKCSFMFHTHLANIRVCTLVVALLRLLGNVVKEGRL